jgi:predicted CXXCH cytochrome family protein
MKYNAVVVLMVLLMRGETNASPGVEIFVPGEHVSSEKCRISVVGRATVPSVRLYLNGEFQAELEVQDSMFHTSVRMPYGLNEIAVVPATRGGTGDPSASDTAQVLCGPEFSREQGRFFREYRFHGKEAPSACLRCHVQDGRGASGRTGAEWCYPCHNTVRQRLREHTVEDIRPCTGCHPVSRDLTASTASTEAGHNPCYQCHQDKIGQFAKDFVHGPVAGGSCTICHDPHGSEFAKTLVSPVPVLCETCHGDVSGKTRPVQHYPFAQGWCIDCHDPHATGNRWVLVKEGQDLCLGCHFNDGTEKTHRHPFGEKPKNKLAVPLRLGEDGKLDCLTCHEPHAATAGNLLRSNRANVCLGCHPDIEQ